MINPEFGQNFKDTHEQMVAQSENTDDVDGTEKSIVDCEELEQITLKTKETLEDLEILTNTEACYKVLLDWVTILNKTYQKFHLIKYKDLESESLVETGSNFVDNNVVVSEENGEAVQNDLTGKASKTNQLKTDSDSKGSLEKNKNETTKSESFRNSETFIKILSDKDFCYLTDPLHLSKDLHQDVSELAQACFDIGCHGDILKFIELRFCDPKDQKKSDGLPNTGNIVSDVNDMDVVIDVDGKSGEDLKDKHNKNEDKKVEVEAVNEKAETEKAAAENDSTECFEAKNSESNHGEKTDELLIVDCDDVEEQCKASITSITDTDDEMQEKAMVFFVRCYFPYLDVDRIREETVSGKTCYNLWSALVTCMEGNNAWITEV